MPDDSKPVRPRHRGANLHLGPLRAVVIVPVVLVAVGLVLALVAVGAGQRTEPSATVRPPSDAPSTSPSPETEPSPTRWRTAARPGIPAGTTSSRQPTAIRLPDGAELEVRRATTDATGELIVPDDVELAGWWDGGARVGDPFGTMVIAAHVDSEIQGLGPFATLLSASEGDAVQALAEKVDQTYIVSSVTRIPRESLTDRADLFSSSGPHRLVLLTCAGDFVEDEGGYQDLAVVVAEPSAKAITPR